jgi:hypothetical protein
MWWKGTPISNPGCSSSDQRQSLAVALPPTPYQTTVASPGDHDGPSPETTGSMLQGPVPSLLLCKTTPVSRRESWRPTHQSRGRRHGRSTMQCRPWHPVRKSESHRRSNPHDDHRCEFPAQRRSSPTRFLGFNSAEIEYGRGGTQVDRTAAEVSSEVGFARRTTDAI